MFVYFYLEICGFAFAGSLFFHKYTWYTRISQSVSVDTKLLYVSVAVRVYTLLYFRQALNVAVAWLYYSFVVSTDLSLILHLLGTLVSTCRLPACQTNVWPFIHSCSPRKDLFLNCLLGITAFLLSSQKVKKLWKVCHKRQYLVLS